MKGILSIHSNIVHTIFKHPINMLQRHMEDENWIYCMLHICMQRWIRREIHRHDVFFTYHRDPKEERYFAYRTNRMIYLGASI